MQKSILTLAFLILFLNACGSGLKEGNSHSNGTTSNSCATTGFCKIFVAATLSNGAIDFDSNNNPIEEADAICENDANKPDSSNYKALFVHGVSRRACSTANCAGGSAEHIDWVMKPNKEYRRVDGTTVIGTTTPNGIFTFNVSNSVEAGGGQPIWTGIQQDWTASTDHCNGWQSSNGADLGSVGHSAVINAAVIRQGVGQCSLARSLYCVEQ